MSNKLRFTCESFIEQILWKFKLVMNLMRTKTTNYASRKYYEKLFIIEKVVCYLNYWSVFVLKSTYIAYASFEKQIDK